jgi:hypothetical protein
MRSVAPWEGASPLSRFLYEHAFDNSKERSLVGRSTKNVHNPYWPMRRIRRLYDESPSGAQEWLTGRTTRLNRSGTAEDYRRPS